MGLILEATSLRVAPHAVDTYIAVDSESGREDIGKIFQNSGHCGALARRCRRGITAVRK